MLQSKAQFETHFSPVISYIALSLIYLFIFSAGTNDWFHSKTLQVFLNGGNLIPKA